MVVMVKRHLERTKTIGASVDFGKTLLSASYDIFLSSILTSKYDRRPASLAAVRASKTLCNEVELCEVKKMLKQKWSTSIP